MSDQGAAASAPHPRATPLSWRHATPAAGGRTSGRRPDSRVGSSTHGSRCWTLELGPDAEVPARALDAVQVRGPRDVQLHRQPEQPGANTGAEREVRIAQVPA